MGTPAPSSYRREPGELIYAPDENPGAGGTGYPWGGTSLGLVGELYTELSADPLFIEAEEEGGAAPNVSYRNVRGIFVCSLRGWDEDAINLLPGAASGAWAMKPANAGIYLTKFKLLFAPEDRASGIAELMHAAVMLPHTSARARKSWGHESRLPVAFYGTTAGGGGLPITRDLLENLTLADPA